MGTHMTIGYENEDGTLTFSYIRAHSTAECDVQLLNEYYGADADAKVLCSFGAMSGLNLPADNIAFAVNEAVFGWADACDITFYSGNRNAGQQAMPQFHLRRVFHDSPECGGTGSLAHMIAFAVKYGASDGFFVYRNGEWQDITSEVISHIRRIQLARTPKETDPVEDVELAYWRNIRRRRENIEQARVLAELDKQEREREAEKRRIARNKERRIARALAKIGNTASGNFISVDDLFGPDLTDSIAAG